MSADESSAGQRSFGMIKSRQCRWLALELVLPCARHLETLVHILQDLSLVASTLSLVSLHGRCGALSKWMGKTDHLNGESGQSGLHCIEEYWPQSIEIHGGWESDKNVCKGPQSHCPDLSVPFLFASIAINLQIQRCTE